MKDVLGLLCSGIGLGLFLNQAVAQRPFESWLTASVSQRYDYGLEFKMEAEQRFSTGEQVYRRYELTPQVIWHYSPRYDFSVGFEENRQWNDQGDDTAGHEGFFSGSIKAKLKQWEFSSRQRFQFGWDDEENTAGIFRQRTELIYNDERFPFKLKPFLSDEWFLDLLEGQGIVENRLQLGLRYEINRSASLELYGMMQNEWSGAEEGTTPVLGLNLNFVF